jgi:type IV pilus assembly protein PilB
LLGRIAEDMGLITDDQLGPRLAEQMNMQVVSLAEIELERDLLDTISETMAQMYRVIPVMKDENTLTLATCDPQNLAIQDELRNFLGYDIRLVIATQREVQRALDRYYAASGESIASVLSELEEDDRAERRGAAAVGKTGAIDLTSVEALADSAPVRKLLNMVLLMAIKDHASDIHFEPFEDEFRIRIKADGVLYEMVPPPAAPGVRDHDAHQGDGQSGHRRAAVAPGRPDRVDGRRAPRRPARQRAADDVRRERRHAGAGPLGRRFGLDQSRHGRTDAG